MNEFDIHPLTVMKSWQRWRKIGLTIAVLFLLGYGVWFTLFMSGVISPQP